MPNMGSSTNPSWAGYAWIGGGCAFASKYTSPNFDILVTTIAAYFDTYQGNGAHGWLCVWNNDGSIRYSHDKGIINNGTLSPGHQQWWSETPVSQLIIPANTTIWIGGYSNQGVLFSTYDTAPHTWTKVMGTGGPKAFSGPSDSGQGPCGGYLVYSQIVKAAVGDVGAAGGGLAPGNALVTTTNQAFLGSGPDGLAPVNTQVLAGLMTLLGGSGGLSVSGAVKVPQIRVWRPN